MPLRHCSDLATHCPASLRPLTSVAGAPRLSNATASGTVPATPYAADGHAIREKRKLLWRVRRIRGQVEAIERAPEDEAECPIAQRSRGGAHRLRCPARLDHEVRHRLAAPHQAVLIRTVVRYSIVQGADVVPHQHIMFRPLVCELVFRL